MAEERSELVRIPDQEALQMLSTIAADEKRTMGNQAAMIIRQEYARRYSQPNPCITVADAERTTDARQ